MGSSTNSSKKLLDCMGEARTQVPMKKGWPTASVCERGAICHANRKNSVAVVKREGREEE